jgi:hypothetical protein
MEMMNLLSVEELSAMRSYIKWYGGENGDSLEVTTSSLDMAHILRFWANEKKELCRLFGNKLILTKHISFRKAQTELEDDIRASLFESKSEGYEFYSAYYQKIVEPMWHEDRDKYYYLRELCENTTLISNVYSGPTFSLEVENGKPLVVNSGCKASKILGKIASSFNLPGYEKFRVAHSMCLNQKNTEGDICLSIHPLDYMTMSDNDCDWSSCMSWKEGGDYRQGTVEMMNSPFVVVAYLKSKSDMDLLGGWSADNCKWSNKKWRQLYIVSPDVIVSIKQYPYDSDDLDTFCLRWLRDLTEETSGFGPFHPQMCRIRNHHNNTLAFLGRSIHFGFETGFMYNDMYSDHNAFVSTEAPESVYICYSGPSECMMCGAEINDCPDDIPTSTLLCGDCGNFMHCDECGRSIDEDNYYWVDDTRLCEHCYENYTSSCNWCEESHFTDNMNQVYLKVGRTIHREYKVTLCSYCMTSSHFRDEVGANPLMDNISGRYYIDVEKLTKTGCEFFEIDEEDLEAFLVEASVSGQQ